MENPHPLVLYVSGNDVRRRIPLLKRLKSTGLAVAVAGSEDPEPFDQEGITYFRYTMHRGLNPLATHLSNQELAAVLREARPTLMHAWGTKPSMFAPGVAARCGVPLRVRTITGMGYTFSPGASLGPILRPLYRLLQRRASRASQLTVFQNSDDRDYFLAHRLADAENTAVVLGSGLEIGAIDSARKQAVESRARLRAELGLTEKDFVVLMVGRLVKHKGVAEYLEAARLVRQSEPRARFLLVGPRQSEGWQAVPESILEKHKDDADWLGPRKDVPDLLAAADLFALPTYYREGVPRVLLEAGAFGLPVVTCDMPGCREVVRHGRNGLLVATRSAEALAEATLAVMRLGSEERTAWGERSRQHVLDGFLLDKVAEEYRCLYSELLAHAQDR